MVKKGIHRIKYKGCVIRMQRKNSFSIKESFAIIRKKWWFILLLTFIGLVTAYGMTTIFVKPLYEAKTVLYIGNENSGLGVIDVSLGQLQAGSQLIIDYKQIALTRLVIDEVRKNLALDIPFNEFENNVIIETVQDSRLFTVGFINSDPQIAKMVSDELAKQLTIAASEIVGVENIRILDRAVIPQKPIAPNKFLNVLIGGLLGLIVSVAFVVISFILKDTIQNEEDIENLIGVAVLASIPEFKEKRK